MSLFGPAQIVEQKEARSRIDSITLEYRSFKQSVQDGLWTGRWTSKRKELILSAVGNGVASLQEIQDIFYISAEEYASWQSAYSKNGRNGLLETKIISCRKVTEIIG